MITANSSKVFVWVNASESMYYLSNLPICPEPDTFEDIHIQAGMDKCCVICKMVNSIELYKFQPMFINGKLFIHCNDVRMLNISNGFIPEYIIGRSSQMISRPKYNPYASKAPNPYDLNQPFSSCSNIKVSTYDDIIKKEEARKRREAICMRLEKICEDNSTILSRLIHMTYMKCIQYYGPDAIHKAPGAIYFNINDNIIECCKLMNQEIKNISAIISVIDEDTKYQSLIASCNSIIDMWKNIESWYTSY